MKTTKQILLAVFLMLLTNNLFADWTVCPGVGTQYGNTLFCVGETIYAGTDFGAYRSTDNGLSWTIKNNGFSNPTHKVMDFSYDQNKLWCATVGSGLYYSTDGGENWIREHSYSVTNSYTIALSGNYVLYSSGNTSYAVRYTTNMGTNWIQMNQGINTWGNAGLIIADNIVYAGDASNGISMSFLGSLSWTSILGSLAGNSRNVNKMRYVNNNLYVGTDAGIWSTSNNGTNWINLNPSLTSTPVFPIEVIGSNIFAGTANKLYLSKNNGSNWSDVSLGLPVSPIPYFIDLAYNSNYVFVITENGFVYRRTLSELGIVGIQNISSQVPDNFNLSQNYPNPFNPTTNINFTVPKSGSVKMIVYDINGREISTLVNQEMTPGTYKVDFDGSNLSSGIYYYTMTSGEFVETKKMMFVK